MKRVNTVRFGVALAVGLAVSLFGGPPGAIAGEHAHGAHGDAGGVTGHSHNAASSHGGLVTMTKEFHFEVAFQRDRVKVYLYDMDQKPISAKGVKGSITLAFRDRARKRQSVTFKYVEAAEHEHEEKAEAPDHDDDHDDGHDDGHGEAGKGNYLEAKLELAKVAEGSAKATLSVTGLPGKQEKELIFKTSFKLARFMVYVAPMKHMPPMFAPGKCPKCGMTLKPKRAIYACSMHPKVTAQKAGGKCWECGMKMVLTTAKTLGGKMDGTKKKAGGDGHGGHAH